MLEKKLDGNCTRMLRAILNKSWKQNPTKKQLFGHQPSISKTIHRRRTRHVGYCWRSKDELKSDILQWTPSHGRASVGRPTRTTTALYGQRMSSGRPAESNGWERWMVRESRKSVLGAQYNDDECSTRISFAIKYAMKVDMSLNKEPKPNLIDTNIRSEWTWE